MLKDDCVLSVSVVNRSVQLPSTVVIYSSIQYSIALGKAKSLEKAHGSCEARSLELRVYRQNLQQRDEKEAKCDGQNVQWSVREELSARPRCVLMVIRLLF